MKVESFIGILTGLIVFSLLYYLFFPFAFMNGTDTRELISLTHYTGQANLSDDIVMQDIQSANPLMIGILKAIAFFCSLLSIKSLLYAFLFIPYVDTDINLRWE